MGVGLNADSIFKTQFINRIHNCRRDIRQKEAVLMLWSLYNGVMKYLFIDWKVLKSFIRGDDKIHWQSLQTFAKACWQHRSP